MKALVDADHTAYRAASSPAARRPAQVEWDTSATLRAIRRACEEVEKMARKADCDEILLIFSPTSRRNFRKSLGGDYKAHRGSEKPESYWEIVDGLKSNFDWFEIDGLEADDTMGIIQTSDSSGDTTIISVDKDMMTVPGLLFRPMKDEFSWEVSPALADYNWMYQTLVGDTADGYKGCPGIGPKKAAAALVSHDMDGIDNRKTDPPPLEEMWPVVLELFRAKSDDQSTAEWTAIHNARLARILRREDFDKTSGVIQLWHPDSPESMSLDDFRIVT